MLIVRASSRRRLPQPPQELVERAPAAARAGEPDTPQDFDASQVAILAQPTCDLRRVLRHHGRARDLMKVCTPRRTLDRRLVEPPGPDDQGLLSRRVIRRFHGVWPLETPVTLLLPDSMASTVKPEDPAIWEQVRELRPYVIACRAPDHADGGIRMDVPHR